MDIIKRLQENSVFYKEIFEYNCYHALSEELADSVVIDIGAHIGYFSIFACLNKAKRVYSLEPDFDNYKQLLNNCNDFNIIPINLAVAKSGLRQIKMISQGNTSHFSENGDLVNCISLKELVDIISGEDLILKIDCEGSEYDIIFSCPIEILIKFKYIYAEIHIHELYNSEDLKKYIEKAGFKSELQPFWSGVWYDNGIFVPSELNCEIIKFTRV